MKAVCLDLEGVLVPEIWVAFAQKTKIEGFSRTTRDEPDYGKLMRYRLDLLDKHNLGLAEITDVIQTVEPFPGALEFLSKLRERTQVLIISDTFEQFARPLMRKLGWPTLFCNSLIVSDKGRIEGYSLRCENSKLTTVKALQSCGFETIAAGDSFNDLGMIRASKAGFLFRTTDAIRRDNPDLRAFTEYDEFFHAIDEVL